MKPVVLLCGSLAAGLAHAAGSLAGLADVDADGTARIYFSRPAPPALPIFMQWPDARGRLRCCIKIDPQALKKIDQQPGADELQVMDPKGMTDIAGYRVTSRLPALPEHADGFVSMAVAAGRVTPGGSPYRLRAESNGKKMTVRTCFGSEGQNLIASEGGEYQLLYISFGYDIDEKPKCSAADERILSGG